MANPEHVKILKQGVDVWNRWRKENPDEVPVLSLQNFDGANFNGADFSNTDLRHAYLTNADLCKSNLINADLRGANLSKTKLNKATFTMFSLNKEHGIVYVNFAKISRANFNEADLSGTSLNKMIIDNVSLDQTIFNGTVVQGTIFANVDLSTAIGLDKVHHYGPSTVGIETIYKSKGQIPEVFLRGCGVPENFIAYMKSFTMDPIEYYSCFISYSHQDKSFAKRLHDQLQARGIRCWLDEKQLLPGDDIYEQVDRGIRMWDKVLLCCSKDSLTSWWVDNEIGTAFSKEQQLMKERRKKVLSLVPLNLDGYMFSDEWGSGKALQIKERLAADFTGWETNNAKFEEQFERVVKALQTVDAREDAPVSRL